MPLSSSPQFLPTGLQFIKNMAATAGSTMLRLMIILSVYRFIYSAHPEDDILRRNKATNILDHTEAAMVMMAEMASRHGTLVRASFIEFLGIAPKPAVYCTG